MVVALEAAGKDRRKTREEEEKKVHLIPLEHSRKRKLNFSQKDYSSVSINANFDGNMNKPGACNIYLMYVIYVQRNILLSSSFYFWRIICILLYLPYNVYTYKIVLQEKQHWENGPRLVSQYDRASE